MSRAEILAWNTGRRLMTEAAETVAGMMTTGQVPVPHLAPGERPALERLGDDLWLYWAWRGWRTAEEAE